MAIFGSQYLQSLFQGFSARLVWLQCITNGDISVAQNVHFDGLVQERRNSSVLAMELRLSCTNPSI